MQAFNLNWISAAIVVLFVFSVIQGIRRGASGSAKHLASQLMEGFITIIGLYLAYVSANYVSPHVQQWLTDRHLEIPKSELNLLQQLYYTMATGVRDFALLRFGVIFLLTYTIVKSLLYWITSPLLYRWASVSFGSKEDASSPGWLSSMAGGVLGAVSGVGRSLLLIAALFVYTTLWPQSAPAQYIAGSSLYQKGASEVVKPITGDFIANQIPVLSRAVEKEFSQILQRKYEVIDARVPAEINDAALQITANAKTDEEKAKLLYKWVGTRIEYDWNKVELYETKRIWKEQTPEDTFASRKGVCIDYSRLYAVMARAVGLDVKVVTGLGYDGKGGYGPHAWNEVLLTENDKWVPLDSTWVASGGNWFNPPNFNQTHIREA